MSASKYDIPSFILSQHSLSSTDREGLLYLLSESSSHGHIVSPVYKDRKGIRPPKWSGSLTLKDVVMSKQMPIPPERVYKVRGVSTLPDTPEVLYELASNPHYIRQWDPLLNDMFFISRQTHSYPILELGYAWGMYKIPGFTFMFSDRDFVARVVGLELPDGTRMLLVKSVPERDIPGAPECPTGAVRGHVAESGIVIAPVEGGKSLVTFVLQVDPKGWVPPAVSRLGVIAVPLNLHYMHKAALALTEEDKESIHHKEKLMRAMPPLASLEIPASTLEDLRISDDSECDHSSEHCSWDPSDSIPSTP